MKAKTAKRFLKRNWIKMLSGDQPPSFYKRWKQASSDVFKEEKK